jgi:alkanesulfonate monooxygenase
LLAATSKIKFLVALRHTAVGGPTVFARQAASLGEALNGRLPFNVVPGAWPGDRAREGVFQHDERYESADEFWSIWKKVLEGETVTHHGKYYQVEGARALYSSVQKPYPPHSIIRSAATSKGSLVGEILSARSNTTAICRQSELAASDDQ